MGEAAGLAAIGYHGLLIVPPNGARVRVSTIYVGIDDLPQSENQHLSVRDICANCRRCVRSCPHGAIEPRPVPKRNGGQGFSMKEIMTFAGHSSIQMTMERYGHLFPSPDHQTAMAMVEAKLLG